MATFYSRINGFILDIWRVFDEALEASEEQAKYLLVSGTIARTRSDGSTITPPPADPVRLADRIHAIRGGVEITFTVDELRQLIGDGGSAGPTITLSKTTFAVGTAKDAILATVGVPNGWGVVAETSFGGRLALSGLNLIAAQALTAEATGQIRFRATNPGNTESIVKTFDITITGVVASSPGGGPNNVADHADPNNAYLVALAA